MFVVRKPNELENLIDKLKKSNKKVGFVPTMGALHKGHLSLLEQSKKENDFSVVSIFVNPTQFNSPVDLEKYPRTELMDLKILEEAGCDVVFVPDVLGIYPGGTFSEKFDFKGLEFQMEGKFRPGHFDGVGTVVKRLFEIVSPDNAYFGEKDFQQLRIIQQMVELLGLEINIVAVPIMREDDGLAMSSRNQRLTPEMRKEAPKIYQILKEAAKYFQKHPVKKVREFVIAQFEDTILKLEYFEIADEKTLRPIVDCENSEHIRAFVAVFAGDIRLIDNLKLK